MHREERVPVCRQMGVEFHCAQTGGIPMCRPTKGWGVGSTEDRWGGCTVYRQGGGVPMCRQGRVPVYRQTGGSSTVQTNRGEFHCADRQGGIPMCRQAELTWRLLGGLAVLGLGRAQSYEPRLPLLGLSRLHIVVLLSGNDQV